MKQYSTISEQARKLALRATKNHNPSREQFREIMQEFAAKFPAKG